MEVLPPVFGRLKHGRSGPARTACVVAENRRIRPGRRSGPPPGIRPKLEEERERNETDSQKERVCRLLEGGDRTVGWGERGLEVVENLRVGRPRGRTSRPFRRRPIGRRTATQQCCADRTLIPSKPRPDPPEGPVAPGTVGLADRRCDAAGDGALEEPQTVRAVRLSRRIFSANQTLTVRPQPHRRWRLLQKTRRARTVRRGLPSSNPVRTPCRMSVPTVRQCGHGVRLSRSTIAAHSASSR